jgi:hypothetical protein
MAEMPKMQGAFFGQAEDCLRNLSLLLAYQDQLNALKICGAASYDAANS